MKKKPKEFWRFERCKIVDKKQIYDGDSISINSLDLGFHVGFNKIKLRLFGIDTPEIRTKDKKEKEMGLKVRNWLRRKLKDKIFTLEVYGKGKYGRWLADIFMGGKSIVKEMIKLKLGKEYFGGKK